jgi:uncharacterized protein
MYAVGAAHPLKEPCVAILAAIARGDVIAVTNSEVLQGILHRYTALGQRERAIEIVRLFVEIVPDVVAVTTDDLLAALTLHQQHAHLPARDSVHLAVMQRHGLTTLLSADSHFDRSRASRGATRRAGPPDRSSRRHPRGRSTPRGRAQSAAWPTSAGALGRRPAARICSTSAGGSGRANR